jgi:serpin B
MLFWKSERDLFVCGSTQFALELVQRLTSQERNLFFSPYILSSLLAMVYAGARGDTAAQMAEVLHFPSDHEKLHGQITDLHERFLACNKSGHYELRIGNRLWSQIGYPLRESFLDILARYYRGGVELVDFSQSDQVCRVINRWVEDETAGLIKNLVSKAMLNRETRMVLTSAIYFKGSWISPFKQQNTHDQDFWIAPQKGIQTPMMPRQ